MWITPTVEEHPTRPIDLQIQYTTCKGNSPTSIDIYLNSTNRMKN